MARQHKTTFEEYGMELEDLLGRRAHTDTGVLGRVYIRIR